MRKVFLLIFYVVASIIIGKEFHPFSRFPMYSTFPSYSYSFYLNNERGDLVPFTNYFSVKKAWNVSHQYFSFFDFRGYNSGFGVEDSNQLGEAGKDLMHEILMSPKLVPFDFDTLILFRRCYCLKNGTINYTDKLLYEQAVKP